VVARLQEQGHLPVEAKLASEARGRRSGRAVQAQAVRRCTAGAVHPAAGDAARRGQPLDRALGILLELPEDEVAKRTIADVRDAVRGGSALSTALDRQHGTFSRLYVNMVRAGEAGGSLHETLSRLADYLERAACDAGPVINALIYPAILLAMVGLSLLFLLGYVVPQFAQMYESLDAELPLFTKIVLGIGLFVRDWWFLLLAIPGRWIVVVRSQAPRSRIQGELRCLAAAAPLRRRPGGQVGNGPPRAHARARWCATACPC
jgi:general secretion pathway protein F